jgi:tetratricopeptide (TPR) repeat protein
MGSVRLLAVSAVSVLLAAASLPAHAQERVFRKEVRQIVGTAQSQDDARAAAVAKAKRDALEESGTWLESVSEVKNLKLVRDDIISVTSGITRTRVLEEEPFLEGRAVGMRVVAEVTVDTSGLAERVRQFMADRERLADKKEETTREKKLLDRLAELEREMAAMKNGDAGQATALRSAVQENSRKLASQEAYHKGDALWTGTGYSDPQAAIAAFSEAIRLDPEWAAPYSRRGRAYTDLNEYGKALEDINHALSLDPKLPFAYVARARTYLGLGQFRETLDDADKALQLNSSLPNAYFLRGVAKRRLSRGVDGGDDIKKACDLGFQRACEVQARGSRRKN